MKKYILIVLGLLLVGCALKGYTTALTQGVTAINEQQYDEAQQHFEAALAVQDTEEIQNWLTHTSMLQEIDQAWQEGKLEAVRKAVAKLDKAANDNISNHVTWYNDRLKEVTNFEQTITKWQAQAQQMTEQKAYSDALAFYEQHNSNEQWDSPFFAEAKARWLAAQENIKATQIAQLQEQQKAEEAARKAKEEQQRKAKEEQATQDAIAHLDAQVTGTERFAKLQEIMSYDLGKPVEEKRYTIEERRQQARAYALDSYLQGSVDLLHELGDRNMYYMSVVKFGGATLTNGQVIAATPTSVTIQYNVSQPEFNGEVTGQGNVTYQLEGETWKVADAQWTPNTTVCVQEECVPAHELNHR